jgi:hypothetical protein
MSESTEFEDPFKRFGKRDIRDDEDGETTTQRFDDSSEDQALKGSSGPPLYLLLSLFFGLFLVCGCCGASGYGVYALIFGRIEPTNPSSSEINILTVVRSTTPNNRSQFNVSYRTDLPVKRGQMYYVVIETTGVQNSRTDMSFTPSALGNLGNVQVQVIGVAPGDTARVWIERRSGGTAFIISPPFVVR